MLLPNLPKIPGVKLTLVANDSLETSEAVAKAFGFARSAADWREVVNADDIDAIVVGTRTEAHFEMIPPVLDAGRHVFSMNALCRNAARARELTVKAASCPDLVALVYPAAGAAYFLREHSMMRHLIEDGYVGTVLQVANFWYAPFFGLGSIVRRWKPLVWSAHESLPRFEDAMRLLQFGEVWRESKEKGGWCDLPQ